MSLKGQDNNNWIDDVIKQHKKQLEDMKKNRTSIDEIEEKSKNCQMNLSGKDLNFEESNENEGVSTPLEESQENLFKNNLERAGYLNIKENFAVDNESNKTSSHAIKYNLPYQKTSERYQNYKETPKNFTPQTEDGEEALQRQNIKSSLDAKNLGLRELKRQLDVTYEENSKYKIQINDLSEKLLICEEEKRNNEEKYIERERELVSTIKQIEQDKMKSEERLNKISSIDNIKSQEIDLMNQKIKDFEVILDENTNDYLMQIKNLKADLEGWKAKSYEYEKINEIMNYFFKKIWSLYALDVGKTKLTGYIKLNNSNSSSNDNIKDAGLKEHFAQDSKQEIFFQLSDPKSFQNNLIELENFIIKLVNEKNTLQLKYHKILDMNTKLTQGESLDTSEYHIESLKKLNEQIFDLAEENKYLKEQLEKLTGIENNNNKRNNISNHNHSQLRVSTSGPKIRPIEVGLSTVKQMRSTEKENVFANNYTKENADEEQLGDYKTLEQRVNEIEKELLFHRHASAKSKESIVYATCENAGGKRSKSINKTISTSSPVEQIKEMKKGKKKKTKFKLKDEAPKRIENIRTKSPLAVAKSMQSGNKATGKNNSNVYYQHISQK